MQPIKNGWILTDDEVARLTATPVPAPAPVTPVPVSTAGRIFIPGVYHEYSTFYAGSIDHAWYLFLHPGGAIGLYNADGSLRKILHSKINHGCQPRWLRQHAHQFYYLYLNEIRRYDVLNDADILMRKFDAPPYAFPSISMMGEADVSYDADHLVLCSGQTVFVYQISADRIVAEFLAHWAFDNLYLTPDNRAVISFFPDAAGTQRGVYVYDPALPQLRKVTDAIGHMDTGRDVNGESILVWCNSADSSGPNKSAAVSNCPNGIVKVNTNTGKQTCLTPIDWSLAVHISIPDNLPWCLVSTYDPRDPNSTKKYANELLKVALDGSGVQSLGKHGADASTYEGQPRASVSHDGKRIVHTTKGGVVVRDV